MKHIDRALKGVNERKVDEEPSILQRMLEVENDPKIACILALDMFLVGVDTVRKKKIRNSFSGLFIIINKGFLAPFLPNVNK